VAQETYVPEVLPDGVIDHGIMTHRKTARRMRVLEVDGVARFMHPETGAELTDTPDSVRWNHVQETQR
jgi:hypothetical protein